MKRKKNLKLHFLIHSGRTIQKIDPLQEKKVYPLKKIECKLLTLIIKTNISKHNLNSKDESEIKSKILIEKNILLEDQVKNLKFKLEQEKVNLVFLLKNISKETNKEIRRRQQKKHLF